MTDDVIHSTQYCFEYINSATLANLQHRSLKLGSLLLYGKHTYEYQTFHSHGISLFPSPHPLDFNSQDISDVTYCYLCANQRATGWGSFV